MTAVTFDEQAALQHEPFDGDYSDATPLSNKIVNGRKTYECHYCAGPIEPGERHRALIERDNEENRLVTFRFCGLCCVAMAKDESEGEDDATEARISLGQDRRKQRSA